MMNRILSELSVQIYWNVHIGFSQLNDKWDLSENSVSILFVGDGVPVPFHISLFTVSPNPFRRFSRLLREVKRLPYSPTNSKFAYHRTIPSGSGWERIQITLVTTWPPALRANSHFLVCIFHQKAFSAFKHLRNTEKSPPIDGIKTAYRGALSYSAWPTRNQSSSRATTNGR